MNILKVPIKAAVILTDIEEGLVSIRQLSLLEREAVLSHNAPPAVGQWVRSACVII